jgi:membrane fusion protein
LQHASERTLGTVLITLPRSYTVLSMFAGLIPVALFGLLRFGSVLEKVAVTGALQSSLGVNEIRADRPGMVTAIFAVDGQRVVAGAPIVRLTHAWSTGVSYDQHAEVAETLGAEQKITNEALSLISERESERREALQRQVESLRDQYGHLATEAQLQQQKVALLKKTLERFKRLAEQNGAPKVVIEEHEANLTDGVQRSEEIEFAEAELREKIQQLQNDRSEADTLARLNKLQTEKSLLDIDRQIAMNNESAETVLRAPRTGEVAALSVHLGDSVNQGQSLASLVPEETNVRGVTAVLSRSIGFVERGDDVVLRYGAFPFERYGQFHGTVSEVDPVPISIKDSRASSDASYRVTILPDLQQIPTESGAKLLRPGMSFSGYIVLKKRKLYEWILDPARRVARQLEQ